MNRNFSTFEQIMKRRPIVSIDESERKEGTFIVTFQDGTQANVDYATMDELCQKGNWVKHADN